MSSSWVSCCVGAFCMEYYLGCSDWLKLARWLAAWNPLCKVQQKQYIITALTFPVIDRKWWVGGCMPMQHYDSSINSFFVIILSVHNEINDKSPHKSAHLQTQWQQRPTVTAPGFESSHVHGQHTLENKACVHGQCHVSERLGIYILYQYTTVPCGTLHVACPGKNQWWQLSCYPVLLMTNKY